jgi:hypothetical protein
MISTVRAARRRNGGTRVKEATPTASARREPLSDGDDGVGDLRVVAAWGPGRKERPIALDLAPIGERERRVTKVRLDEHPSMIPRPPP